MNPISPKPSKSRRFFRSVVALLAVVAVAAVGCRPAKPRGAVRGTVTFRGEPVTKGIVMLYSAKAGYGDQREITADGSFFVDDLPYGPFQLAVHPPMVMDDFGGKSAPSLRTVEVDNIPKRYRSPSTSGFSCEVSGPSLTVDLPME